ncbi:MAG: hypothetical protein IK047_06030 [Clostridia bacterium]|nr:hypothetical protein [Clostridia bacterium]
MKRTFVKDLTSRRGGLPRAAAVLLALVFIMLAVISVPLIKHFRDRSRKIGCETALDTADKELRSAYLISGCSLTPEQAKEAVTRAMNGWDDLCPAGGTVHLVYDEGADMPYRLVCGIHGSDEEERTRLNAEYVFGALSEEVKKRLAADGEHPGSVAVRLNGEELNVLFTGSDVSLYRGTDFSSEYKGVVAFYTVAGEGGFGDSFGAAPGSISWFAFADERHCAKWNARLGWTLDSFDY